MEIKSQKSSAKRPASVSNEPYVDYATKCKDFAEFIVKNNCKIKVDDK